MNEKPVILVTAAGTVTASHIIKELNSVGGFYIIGTDINPANQIATSADVDEFHVFPPAIYDLEGYITFVLDFCKQKHIEYYYATIDEEVANLSAHRELFELLGVRLCIPNDYLIDTCHYKDKFNQWVAQEIPEIAIKTFLTADEVEDEDFPLFAKPIEGRASIGCREIANRDDLLEYLKEADTNNVIIQHCVSGEIITVDLVRNAKTGQRTQMQRKELLRNGNGCGIAVETIDDPDLHEICEKLMIKLDLNGVVNAEFFKTDTGYKIIEVNPRFSAGTSFSCMAGCNTVLNALWIAQGKECEFGEVRPGQHFAKRYETYRMD
jgi:carbamoyl-phosphate synthase large subunit